MEVKLSTCQFRMLAPVVQNMEKTTIQWTSERETNCAIQWKVIDPVDSTIHLLTNWGMIFNCTSGNVIHPNILLFNSSNDIESINAELPVPLERTPLI